MQNKKLVSEDTVLSLIDTVFSRSGRGDDCAVLPEAPYVISTDTLTENVDFRKTTFTPQDIGYKVLAANISDILAMGAKPTAFLMALSLSEDVSSVFFTELLQGIHELAHAYDIALVGGDTDVFPFLSFSITILGIPYTKPFLRGRSQIGDIIFTISPTTHIEQDTTIQLHDTPSLGLARLGFTIIDTQPELEKTYPTSCLAQRKPFLVPLNTVESLAHWANTVVLPDNSTLQEHMALMDISDGLVQDLPRLLGTNKEICANITLPQNLIHPEILRYCKQYNRSPFDYIMKGGEEYCLLGTIPASYFEELQATISGVTNIGTVQEGKGVLCHGTPYTQKGFDHFL